MVPEIAFALLVASASAAADTLDSSGHAPPALVERVRSEVGGKRARITTELARYDVRVGRLDGVGLGGFKKIGQSPHPPDPITWPSVLRIEAVHTNTLLGMGIGTAAVLGLCLAKDADPTALVTTTILGGWLGGQVGCRITRGEPVYVAQPRTPSPSPVAAVPVAPAAASLAPAPAAPTVVPAGIDVARIDKACARIHHDRLLLVTFEDLPSVEGYALNADRNGLHSLQPKKPYGSSNSLPEVISWSRIDGVQGRGTFAARGAVVGAVGVGVTGAIFGTALGAYGVGGGGGGGAEIAGGAVLGALVGAATGGLFGALFGAAIPAWHVVY